MESDRFPFIRVPESQLPFTIDCIDKFLPDEMDDEDFMRIRVEDRTSLYVFTNGLDIAFKLDYEEKNKKIAQKLTDDDDRHLLMNMDHPSSEIPFMFSRSEYEELTKKLEENGIEFHLLPLGHLRSKNHESLVAVQLSDRESSKVIEQDKTCVFYQANKFYYDHRTFDKIQGTIASVPGEIYVPYLFSGVIGFVIAIASHLIRYRFCPKCGHKLMQRFAGSYVLKCSDEDKCKNIVFPVTSPCVIVIIVCFIKETGKSVCLFGHRSGPVYANVSGFIDPCESATAATIREIYEEVGLVINSSQLYHFRTKSGEAKGHHIISQPWPHGGSYMVPLICKIEVETEADLPVLKKTSEIDHAIWMTKDQYERYQRIQDNIIPPFKKSIARQMFDSWFLDDLYLI